MPISPVTIRSSTRVLAYVHSHRCRHLPGRGMANTHLRRLSAWLGFTKLKLRTVRNQPILAAHLALLTAADLLTIADGVWHCTPTTFHWLRQEEADRRAHLQRPFANRDTLDHLIDAWSLQQTLPIDYLAYVQQHLANPVAMPPPPPAQTPATYTPEQWQIPLPPRLPIPTLFHLLQLGQWMPGQPLTCTPLTVARAARRGYSLLTITALLGRAAGAALPPERQQQITAWYRRGQQYTLQPVHLLTTAHPDQLAAIMDNRRLRDRVQEQLSPHHAVVTPQMQKPLRKWLARQNIPLNAPEEPAGSSQWPAPPAITALALQVLAGLGDFVDLPLTLSAAATDAAAAGLDTPTQTRIEQMAQHILDGVRDVIRGRDAFFPAESDRILPWLEQIEQALLDGHTIIIDYQSPADEAPRARPVQPLRLEQRGSLYYLHAYCYLAESNRTFRLDRIHTMRLAQQEPPEKTAPTPERHQGQPHIWTTITSHSNHRDK